MYVRSSFVDYKKKEELEKLGCKSCEGLVVDDEMEEMVVEDKRKYKKLICFLNH